MSKDSLGLGRIGAPGYRAHRSVAMTPMFKGIRFGRHHFCSLRSGELDQVKGVLQPLDLIFEDFVYFLKKYSNFGQSILWIWSEMFQGTQNSQFYFSRDHCCEVTVKNMRTSIFSMF